ncbi:MAG TPA: hypothetical protein PKV48_00855 [Thermodesulfobacteriota bacterium]|nr:hypothetical protein [Thermodesulfobacteriota bacterium]
MGKLVFLAAVEEELESLKSSFSSSKLLAQEECAFIALGVGTIDPLIALAKNQEVLTGEQIIFLGTAGILGKDFVPGETYQAWFFRWTSIGLALKKGFLPPSLYPDIEARKFLGGPPTIMVISSPEITADDGIARILEAENSFCLENLEAYGVASWFKNHHKSISAILSVTNQVGKESHSQYLKYRKLAWLKLADTVYRVIMNNKP